MFPATTAPPVTLAGALSYATDLFDRDTAVAFGDSFVRMLAALVAAPATPVGDVDLLTPTERTRILHDWNTTTAPRSDATLGELFDAQVAATPHAPAVTADGRTLDYADFDAAANRLAHVLVDAGAGPEQVVALAVPRSLDLLVGMYAIVKAGAAYVPLDPEHPPERLRYVLDTAHPVTVLTRDRDHAHPAARHPRPGPGQPRHRDRTRDRTHGRAPARPDRRHPRLRALHLRFDRPAQGCRGRARRHRQPAALDAAHVPADRRRRRGPEDPRHVRRVGVGVLLAAAGRGAVSSSPTPTATATPPTCCN